MKTAAVLLALALAAGPAWAINKCTDGSGKVSFQDAPCADRGGAITVRPASGHAQPVAAGEARARLAQLKQDNEMAEAIRLHRPLVGMTVAQLNNAMGAPTQVNASNYNGTQQDQVIYERPNEVWLVYTRNGVVESIQHRPTSGRARGGRASASGPCPLPHVIRSAITSASSLSLSDAERREQWKSIRAMQACR